MATVYRVLDAVLDNNNYYMTVEINKDSQGPMIFGITSPRSTGSTIDPALIAQAASLWLSSGGGINQLRNQSWTLV